MYYGLDAFKMFIKIYPAPYDDTDIELIDSLLEGDLSIDNEGKFHPTEMMYCAGEA